ncbi:hypothetical protein CDLVIII_2436 [Clostridium sp. DL-VIII]|uniref:hypothetical protein n=1 Tax=Clostridium sp. DL-VIII TaxID=641107 RepID=UPI00023AFF05|nr:hypothetical protein [Clostridium sp. DL-VIII]EHI99080.1 hypothetical protein CDLVIII_2436 [Clostridium sp. DL-VIII]
MRKIRILEKFIALLVVSTIGLCPGIVALADTESQDINLEKTVQVENKESLVADDVADIGKFTATTSSVVVLERPDSETDDSAIEKPVSIDLNNEYNKANEALRVFKVTNVTTEEDVIDLMKGNIDRNIAISIKDFNVIPATIDTFGAVTGILTFTFNGEAQELKIYKPIDKLKVENVVVSSLKVKMNGLEQDKQLLYIGDKAYVQVTGYNVEGKQVELEQSLIQYQWYVDGRAILDGTNSELKITKDMKGKDIKCTVNYDDKGGAI